MAKKEKTTPAQETPAEETEPDLTVEATENVPEEEAPQQPSETELLQKQLADANDKFLRLAAEYDNYRKRTAKEKEELNALCKSTVIREILPVIDNFERAMANPADNPEEFKKGVEMIAKQLSETLQKLGVESFGDEGDAFDPNLHNAVMHIESEDHGENVIAAVFGKGYRLGDKVIRPAMVQVAN